ncbi:MAG: hypothetical protein ACR9NN_18955 [Nostochopsis sp.]
MRIWTIRIQRCDRTFVVYTKMIATIVLSALDLGNYYHSINDEPLEEILRRVLREELERIAK